MHTAIATAGTTTPRLSDSGQFPRIDPEDKGSTRAAAQGAAVGRTWSSPPAGGMQGIDAVIGQSQYEQLQRSVFSKRDTCIYAVLDGAIIDDLPTRLQRHAPGAMCLFSGDLDPMLAAAAPYLLALQSGSGGAQLALRDGWNDHWGIVLVVDPGTDIYALRSHLRRILRVATPDGGSMLFRFYDPRAFRTVVPTLDAEQRRTFFGPIAGCYVEGRSPDSALYFARDGGREPRTVALAAAA